MPNVLPACHTDRSLPYTYRGTRIFPRSRQNSSRNLSPSYVNPADGTSRPLSIRRPPRPEPSGAALFLFILPAIVCGISGPSSLKTLNITSISTSFSSRYPVTVSTAIRAASSLGKMEFSSGNAAKRDGFQSAFICQFQAGAVAGSQHFPVLLRNATPDDRPHRVYDVSRREIVAASDPGLSSPVQAALLFHQSSALHP